MGAAGIAKRRRAAGCAGRVRNVAKLNVTRDGEQWEVSLPREGALIGRNEECDVRLDDHRVSGRHARLFADPAGRWTVEDLASKNGVWIGPRRVTSRALQWGEEVVVGPYTLSLAPEGDRPVRPALDLTVTASIALEGRRAGDIEVRRAEGETLSIGRINQLNFVSERLAKISEPDRLYPELCKALVDVSRLPGVTAMVLRLPRGTDPIPPAPPLLACQASAGPGADVRLSRRILEAARSGTSAVMARSDPIGERDLALTITPSTQPRAAVCAPIAESPEAMEALYLDMPSDLAGPDALDLVQAVARLTKLLRANLILAEEKLQRRMLERDLEMAREIQQALLPTDERLPPGVDVAWHYEPATWVGGDYCDVWRLQDGRLAFAVGDVTGHGLRAAMVMAALHASMRASASPALTPSLLMGSVNRYLQANTPEDMLVTMILGFYEPASGRLECVNAGHAPPILLDPGRCPRPLEMARNLLLGIQDVPYQADAVVLAPGCGLLIVTDGITETASPEGQLLGDEGLLRIVEAAGTASSKELLAAVVRAVADFRHPMGQQDDVTALALRNSPES
jgi:sigma-B regulation protein RsbU (phosphoserine phosphatase)